MAGKLTVHPEGAPPAPPLSARGPQEVVDGLGRKIKFQRLNPMHRMAMLRTIGPAAAGVEQYLGYATIAWCVTQIDDDRYSPPASLDELEMLAARLEDEGIEAVGLAYAKAYGVKPVTEADKDALKN